VGVVYVTDLEAGAFAGETTGTKGRHTALVGDSESGLVWSMNWLNWFVPKNELITELRVLALIRSVGVNTSLSRTFMRSRMVRAIRARPTPNWLCRAARPRCARGGCSEVVDVIHIGLRVNQFDEVLDDEDDVLLGEQRTLSQG
jgi:hypothetical protein